VVVCSPPVLLQAPLYLRTSRRYRNVLLLLLLACRACDQQVAGSNPSCPAVECNPGQVVNTHVPPSPSSIIWYQPVGGDALRLGR